MSDTISLEGLDKAEVLAALYNAARPQGMGFLQYDPMPMRREEARKLLDSGATYFDYLKGRVMKVDLSGQELRPGLYDRDNGAGAAGRAIESLGRDEWTEGATVTAIHADGRKEAAALAAGMLGSKTVVNRETSTIELGLDDIATVLGPKVAQWEEKGA